MADNKPVEVKKPAPSPLVPGTITPVKQAELKKLEPVKVPDKALVLLCTGLVTKIAQVKVEEGKDEKGKPLLHECMRNATAVTFRADNPDPKMLPNVELIIESTDLLPFETGKRYALELREVEK